MPINYLNLYVFAIFGGLAATVGGIMVCYSGMSETSFLVYRGMEITTYYIDKNRHDLYVNGIVYSITFGIAFLLLLAVIVIPSPEQIQKRLSVQLAPDNIRLNNLMPGRINTDRLRSLDGSSSEKQGVPLTQIQAENYARIPLGRYGTIEEFGRTGAFLLSDAASYITGSSLAVDGGVLKTVW